MASDPAQALSALDETIDTLEDPAALLAHAATVEDFGRQLALQFQADPAGMVALRPVLVRVPAVHTRVLVRCAEKLDDRGSPRRAARVLLEALRRAVDADMVDGVVEALGFTLEAFGQRVASARLRELLEPAGATRRERRERHLAIVDELATSIEWSALDDELIDT